MLDDSKAWELNPAKIVGECRACHHLFDVLRNGLRCDACGSEGVRNARWADVESPVIDLDPGATKEITWLEKLYALPSKDTR